MKTITDIKQALTSIDTESKLYSKEATGRAIKLFEGITEIDKILSDLENMENGEYSFDALGELVYSIEVPKDIADLPFINDYLTKDYGNLTGFGHNDLRLSQCCGDYISIDNSGDSRSYFVYDSESNKEIVNKSDIREDGHPTISEDQYIAAKIEMHQLDSGCFNDVIEVDYHGSYVKHFSTFDALGIKTETTKEFLQNIINEYEKEDEEG